MLAKNLARAIIKRGGTAQITERTGPRSDPWGNPSLKSFELSGVLNGYDVHMYGNACETPDELSSSHFTVRPIVQRGYHDAWSDYNPGGYTFCNRIKDLDWAAQAHSPR